MMSGLTAVRAAGSTACDQPTAADAATYTSAWKQVSAKESASGSLAELARLISAMLASLDHTIRRQTYPRERLDPLDEVLDQQVIDRSQSWKRKGPSETVMMIGFGRQIPPRAGKPGDMELVTSLDQLLDQAAGLQHFLRRKVRALLRGLPAAGGGAAEGGAPEVRVGVKPAERAAAKAARCYGSDASRLADCCRAAVVFERAAGVAGFVGAVDRDAEVEVVWAKNGYDPAADAAETGGFR
jgi:hypothetical protein